MDTKKSSKLLLIASVLMLVAAISFIIIKIFADDTYSTAMSIIFAISAVLLFFAQINFNKSEGK